MHESAVTFWVQTMLCIERRDRHAYVNWIVWWINKLLQHLQLRSVTATCVTRQTSFKSAYMKQVTICILVQSPANSEELESCNRLSSHCIRATLVVIDVELINDRHLSSINYAWCNKTKTNEVSTKDHSQINEDQGGMKNNSKIQIKLQERFHMFGQPKSEYRRII